MNHNLFPFGGGGSSGIGLFDDAVSFLLIDTAVKSFLFLTATLVVACLMRKRSVAAIHRLWTLGFCGCLVIPVIAMFSPIWSLSILPDSWLNESNNLEIAAMKLTAYDATAILPSQDIPASSGDVVIPNPMKIPPVAQSVTELGGVPTDRAAVSADHNNSNGSDGVLPSIVSGPVQANEAAASEFSWTVACFAGWVGGVLFCLLRTVWHQLSLGRVLNRSSIISNEEWARTAADASQSLGLNRIVQLRKLDDAQSPMIAGILRTVVLLPGDADNWNPSRRRLVLLHELAHAKRHDVLTQTIAGFVCALHWFNPVCWVGLFQMRKLRELACDDLVLACGQRPTDYADVLLDVARSYRHRNLTTAIGMARRANVENRILALLDKARSHVSLSRKAACTLLVSATAIVVLIGSMRLKSQADPQTSPLVSESETSTEVAQLPKVEPDESNPADNKATEKAGADDGIRTMEICVRDENGKPIEGANLHVSIWDIASRNGKRKFIPNADYLTDSDGIVNIKIPRRLRILRLWPRKAGYVPEFVNFAKGTHDEGTRIPDRYEFELARGAELSGAVVDKSGQPIPGVTVNVRVEGAKPVWSVNPKPIISTWLTDEDPAVTDKNGKWKIINAPGEVVSKDHKFYLKFTHKEYISDSKWGELQSKQKLTTVMLRDGSAKMVLSRGISVAGTVIDSSGNPVTKGLVIWHDDPYHGSEVHETKIDSTGHFETLPLPPGEYPITVVAPGFKPVRRMVNVTKSMEELSFAMQPGKRLTLKIVDPNGKPIPNAYVALRKWRDVQSLYNHRHPNVPDSRIPRQSDEKGVYVWDWAPDDAVTYQVSAKEFLSNTVTLIATEAEHIVKLTPRLIASGTVTDAKTGKPVKEFRVVPVIVFRPAFLSTSFDDEVPGEDGNYEIELTDMGQYDYRYQIRIDADGYRSAISEKSFGLGDGRVTQYFSLEPAAAREGIVVDEKGKPVASASVIKGTPSIVPHMRNTELEWNGRQIKTSGDGRFQLAATFEPIRIRVTHESGFAEVLRQPNEAIGTIQLQRWAKVSGRLLQDGNPIPEETVYFYPVLKGRLGEPRFQDSFHTRTDSDGRFEFKRLPPIAGMVRASLGPWRDSPLTSSQSVPLNLQPGENKTISLGGNGITVMGKVVATGRGEATLNKNWSLNHLIRRDRGIKLPKEFPELSFDPAGRVQASWFLDPNRYDWLATRQNHFVKLAPNGQLHISGVSPGTYDLVLRLYEQPAGCLVETIGQRVVPIDVTTSDVSSGTKDIGTIEVECRAGPRVGENMQIYRFTDTSGRKRSIKDIRGRYVLMHVWASWCAPCLECMPDIHATIKSLSDQPITFVGLNIDKDATKAKALAQRGDWNWSQNYLGDDSDMARQLAISSVPTYFLIGPDGLLAASAADWSDMKDTIEAALNEQH